ncbi:ATP-binding protein [Methanospirillum lacunae]|uniref:Histidine kinase/HSP90-like ATPase domain-containing protein n=1 Tax=Methanospirillum lacunae TaxID=668570 RepID=A0A2V2MYA0_9EURY|nr:ATP-binding protein [Methanospirillum lacunae]PWR70376.1 hypothetical protein DK846_14955 [Methanospirillum lacunae]
MILVRTKTRLIISCIDDKVGIPPDEKGKFFPWYGKHTGVGLFLSRKILAITGLSIRETGKEREGARFEIVVPEGKYRYI